MDVDMRAPVITMPLSSFSDDEIEVDLGHLHLANRVVSEVRAGKGVVECGWDNFICSAISHLRRD
jgi:hypothetical protein